MVQSPEGLRSIRRLVFALFAVTLVGVLAACGGSDSPDAAIMSPAPTRTLLPVTATSVLPAATLTLAPTDLPDPAALMTQTAQAHAAVADLPASALAQIDRATADLAAQVDATREEIYLISLEAFTWRDTAWGCNALNDRNTTPEITRGYRIILQVDDQIVVYHTDEDATAVQCPDANWLALEGRPIVADPISASIVELSRQDAARRLNLPSAQVRAVSVIAVNWPDSSLGCPRVDVEYTAQPTRGYRLVFEAGSTRLIYHTSIQDSVLCEPEDEILPGTLRQALPLPPATATPGG